MRVHETASMIIEVARHMDRLTTWARCSVQHALIHEQIESGLERNTPGLAVGATRPAGGALGPRNGPWRRSGRSNFCPYLEPRYGIEP